MKPLGDLTQAEALKIKEDIAKRRMENPFSYYINNCTSFRWCPKRLWSAACDLVHWLWLEWYAMYEPLMWWYINEIFYSSNKNNLELIKEIVKYTIPEIDWLQEVFLKRLQSKYLIIWDE